MRDEDLNFLRQAIEVARHAREHGNHPFGAVLTDAQSNVLLQGENTVNTARDATGHAEMNLVRAACATFDAAFLSQCTLYSSTEPCPMCSGAIFWSAIGRVVYALSEDGLYAFAPDSPHQLPVGCREILSHGARHTAVIGPALEDEARAVHVGFWE